MIAHGFVDRATQDVDLFTEIDDDEALAVAKALRAALLRHGLDTRDAARPPRDHRFVTADPNTGHECLVEVFADGGRLRPRTLLDIGPVLHRDDLAADKLLALWGRARPRDFYDVRALLKHYSQEQLFDLAKEKDAGFSVTTFIDALTAINRLSSADWAEDGIESSEVLAIMAAFADWRSRLASELNE